MADTPPDRLSNDPRSPFFKPDILERGIGVRFKGVERTNVGEYCVSEAWVAMPVGKTVDRRGLPLLMRQRGPVEVWFLDEKPPEE